MLSLRPYQESGADFLYEHDRAMILAPVGAGKTAMTLTAMRDLAQREGDRFLVVAAGFGFRRKATFMTSSIVSAKCSWIPFRICLGISSRMTIPLLKM